MNLQNRERVLKDLIEDRGVGFEKNVEYSKLKIKVFEKANGVLTYDECISLAEADAKILESLPSLDIAFDHFYNSYNGLLRYAEAKNDLETMGRKDHLLSAKILLAVNDTVVECEVWFSKVNYSKSRRTEFIRSAITEKLSRSSDWCGSLRHPAKMEFVEM